MAPQEEAKKRMLRKSMTEERGEREPVNWWVGEKGVQESGQ